MLVGLKVFILLLYPLLLPSLEKTRADDSDSPEWGRCPWWNHSPWFYFRHWHFSQLWSYGHILLGQWVALMTQGNACSSSDHLGSQRWPIYCQLDQWKIPERVCFYSSVNSRAPTQAGIAKPKMQNCFVRLARIWMARCLRLWWSLNHSSSEWLTGSRRRLWC